MCCLLAAGALGTMADDNPFASAMSGQSPGAMSDSDDSDDGPPPSPPPPIEDLDSPPDSDSEGDDGDGDGDFPGAPAIPSGEEVAAQLAIEQTQREANEQHQQVIACGWK